MTTTEQPAAGWWLASDGNWYPPESAPGTTVVVQQAPVKKDRSTALQSAWVVAFMLTAVFLVWGCSAMASNAEDEQVQPIRAAMPAIPSDEVAGAIRDDMCATHPATVGAAAQAVERSALGHGIDPMAITMEQSIKVAEVLNGRC